jgi:predicted transcriptional regulator
MLCYRHEEMLGELIWEHGFSQSEIARRLGVSKPAVSQWRHGKRRPSAVPRNRPETLPEQAASAARGCAFTAPTLGM